MWDNGNCLQQSSRVFKSICDSWKNTENSNEYTKSRISRTNLNKIALTTIHLAALKHTMDFQFYYFFRQDGNNMNILSSRKFFNVIGFEYLMLFMLM